MRSVAAALALVLVATPADAQDSHYWAEQYGTRAALLGGALIGSVQDLSAVYYNPGAAALHRETSFVLSARAYRRSARTLENGAGQGLDLTSSSQRPIATFVATPIEFDWLGRHVLIYSALTRQQFDADVSTQRIGEADVLPEAGTEAVAGAYTGSANMRETWTGLTWAYPLSDRVGIGVSQYLVIRNQDVGSRALAQAATTSGDVAVALLIRSRRYTHYRMLTKVGLSYDRNGLSLGLTATAPSVSLSGSGSAIYNAAQAGRTGGEADLLASNLQTDLPADFKNEWAVGAGLGLQLGSARLHASAEWFAAIEQFTALDAQDVVPQAGDGSVVNDLTAEFRSVLDWGVGIEQPVGGAMLFAGLASDRSAGVPESDPETDVVLTFYDLWRLSAGASFQLGRSQLMLGIGYASGSQTFPQLFDLDNIEVDLDPTDVQELTLRYSEWTVVLGFELGAGGGGDEAGDNRRP